MFCHSSLQTLLRGIKLKAGGLIHRCNGVAYFVGWGIDRKGPFQDCQTMYISRNTKA